jgi:hypothetical protein
MKWPFGDRARFDRPPPATVIAFPVVKRPIPAPTPDHFVEVDFDTVDEVLWNVRKDIQKGLINPTACTVVMYDKDRECIIWYQKGFKSDDEAAAFEEWLEVIKS